MRKSDILVRSANENCWTHGVPAINVKWYPYFPDIVAKFKGVTGESPHICKVCDQARYIHTADTGHKFKPGGTHLVHEYGDDERFWGWLERQADTDGFWDYPNGEGVAAEEWAREDGWEMAKEAAYEIWGSNAVQVYSSGRSGGHLVVHGLGDIDDWDAIEVMRWTRFDRAVADILDDRDYQWLSLIAINMYEPLLEAVV